MKKRLAVFLALVLLLVPITASANMIWPSLYIIEGMLSWYVIVAGIVIELLFVKLFAKKSWLWSAIISLCMNAASAVIGVALVPISGILTELILTPFDYGFNYGTFHISHWIADYIFAVACNVLLEGLVLKLVFKCGFRKNIWWLAVANAITIIICVIAHGFILY